MNMHGVRILVCLVIDEDGGLTLNLHADTGLLLDILHEHALRVGRKPKTHVQLSNLQLARQAFL
jgi:hypothetical protein